MKSTTIASSETLNVDLKVTNNTLSKSLNTPTTKVNGKIQTQRQISAPASINNKPPVVSAAKNIPSPVHTKKSNSLSTPISGANIPRVVNDTFQLNPSISSKIKLRTLSTSVSTTTTQSWVKSGDVPLTSDVASISSSPSGKGILSSKFELPTSTPSTVVCTRQTQVTNTTTPQKIITTANTAFTSGAVRPLPKPIGSNRPFRVLSAPTNSLSSTTVSNSVAATLHSTLNSLLSQVATQRSPMIWNDHPGSKEQLASGDLIVTTVATSPKSTLSATPIDRFLPASLSQSSSQESYKVAYSRTPSLSPTSNHSNSPTPEEKPHLNPIGSERGHKKPSNSNHLSGLQGLAPLLQGKCSFLLSSFLF